jgi:hypothetical protein
MMQNSPENEASSSLEVAQDSEEDKLVHTLADRLSKFQSRSIPDINVEDFIFCKPSREDDPSVPPALQSLPGTNTQYLEYRESVINLHLVTSTLECNGFERCIILKNKLLDELQVEWAKLDELTLHAWQTRMAAQNDPCSNPNTMDLDSAQVIDTCGYH